jgi:hypothetical protein
MAAITGIAGMNRLKLRVRYLFTRTANKPSPAVLLLLRLAFLALVLLRLLGLLRSRLHHVFITHLFLLPGNIVLYPNSAVRK